MINSDVRFQSASAANQTLVLGGSGNWTFNNSLTGLNSVLSLADTGTGYTSLTASSSLGNLLVSGGGTLAVNGALAVAGSAAINAGTLAGSGLVAGNTLLSGNGAINLSGGTIAGTLTSTGGNWNGSGTVGGLVTVGSNTFTVASGATLTARNGLTVAGGATLAGAGTIAGTGTVTLGSGAILAPGINVTTGNVGTLNVPNMALGGGGTAYFDLSSTTTTAGNGANDLVAVGGNLTLGGTTSVYVNLISGTSLVSGTYSLFTYGGNALGAAASSSLTLADPGVLSGRQSYHFDTSQAGAVDLDIVGGPANLNWAVQRGLLGQLRRHYELVQYRYFPVRPLLRRRLRQLYQLAFGHRSHQCGGPARLSRRVRQLHVFRHRQDHGTDRADGARRRDDGAGQHERLFGKYDD